jgi:serine/threonine protein kinase/tetratricopeptide (TPR) repeat protein
VELDASSPGGLCPACLMAGGLESQVTIRIGNEVPRPGPTPAQAGLEDDRFGPYRILRRIGEGGMGSIYLAEQSQPIQRQVALKVIKLGMDTRQVVARFESERQALALMDHPNIAHVYEAGTSERGRPYFVMEYVDGVAITQYCDQHLLNTRERLELFGPVCLALQHAHQKGIIHRDIKPSNVLVTEQDGKPFPKVIDFGIAKATDQRQAEYSAFTLLGNFAGTPEYMSPEQADLSSQDIDTTTDVYSLGVLLYELLVGALPFEGRFLREAGMAELLRIIREEDAPTPSDKLTKLGDTAAEVARCRRTDPATLRRQLAGDLNWIVMKALEKDRRRRYASVSELAADVRRHLEDHPVLASPPSRLYRARKFVRRHKVSVSAGLLVALSLVAGLIAVGWEARVAEVRRRDAEGQRARADGEAAQARMERSRAEELAREANAQRNQAEAHRQEAEAQRRDAEELFGGVRDLANSMIFDVADQIAELHGATAARETLVRKAVTYLDRLSKDPRATPELRKELAHAYLKIGDLQGLGVHPNLGDRTGAFQSYARSVALLEPLVKVRPQDPVLLHLLIEAYRRRGLLQEQEADAETDYARSIAMAEARLAAEPKSQEARHDLASSLAWLTARGIYQATVSERDILRARALFEELVKEGAKDPDIRRELAWQYQNLGNLYMNRDPQRSLNSLSTAIEQFASLAREYPANALYGREHAAALINASRVLQALNRTEEAVEYCKRAVALQQQVVDGDARNVSFRLDLVQFQLNLVFFLSNAGNRQEAMDTLKQALAEREQLVAEQPANPEFRYQRASLNERVGFTAGQMGDPKTALDHWRKAEAELEELVRQHSDRLTYGSLLARLHLHLGRSVEGDGTAGLTGCMSQEYDCSLDLAARYNGQPSTYIKSKDGVKTTGFGYMSQYFSATLYIGKRIRLSANLKSESVKEWGGLWMRVDDDNHPRNGRPSIVAFDNMHDGLKDRSIKGTTGWQNYSVVLDVPESATEIYIGFLLSGPGALWANGIRVEVVGSDVSMTGRL